MGRSSVDDSDSGNVRIGDIQVNNVGDSDTSLDREFKRFQRWSVQVGLFVFRLAILMAVVCGLFWFALILLQSLPVFEGPK